MGQLPTLPARSRARKLIFRGAGIALGLAIVAVGVKWTGVGAIRAALSQVGANIAWMFVAYAAGTAVGAVPWRRLLPQWLRPTWPATLASRFAASGVNALLPFFGLGEAARLLWLPRGQRSPGLAALVVDRLLFLAAGTPILVAAALAATRVPAVPHSYFVAVLISAGIISIAVAAIALGAATGRLAGKLRWALVLFGVPPAPAANGNGHGHANGQANANGGTESIDSGLRALLTGAPATIAGGFALHVCARLLLAAEIYAGLRILGAPVGPLGTLIFIAIPVGLSVIGTFVPGQIGLQEGASALVAAALGIGPATGIALVFLQRLRQLVFVPLAGLLIALVQTRSRTSDP
ncbi:MAG TPA: lysylphosphatidylglycerol synthase domain-containing protein [Polyangia bacterium]|nr:lysylphosphatidylglycerol synthase domain-containing protein [Polyangia bacterium]